MKSNKGVTMMLLVVTIVLMIIIAFLAVYYSQNITPEARVSAAYSSVSAVKDSCKAAVQFVDVGKEDEFYFFGRSIQKAYPEKVDEYATRCGLSSASDFSDRTYLIDPFSTKEEDKRRIQNLELSNLNAIFIADLDNDKYYLVDGVSRSDDETTIKYEYFEIQSLYDMINKYGKV